MLAIMRLELFLILFIWAKSGRCKGCPSAYQRLSATHTFCLKKNPKCDIKFSGVSKKDENIIVNAHNKYRNIVATGKETRSVGGSLPEAADMLQMVWDDELAAIAQKWTDNCEYRHDCRDGCRWVENFQVGQNLARHGSSCISEKCTKEEEANMIEPSWEQPLQSLYDEVTMYKKKWMRSFGAETSGVGHFTQMVWSRSWRIGCGFSVYKDGGTYYKFYACNYGPAGNVKDEPLYKEGKPCSACPVNTCCGKTCGKKVDYSGLCKMLNPNTAPVYPREKDNLLFFCDAVPSNKDCATQMSGTKSWKLVTTLTGNYNSIKLKSGQSTVKKYEKEITPTENTFCVRIIYTKSPLKAGEKDTSVAGLEIITENKVTLKPLRTALSFQSYQISLNWKKPTTIALQFSVPSGQKPHIFYVKEIVAYNGQCSN